MNATTHDLIHLVTKPEMYRDAQWENDFLKTFSHCSLTVEHDEPRPGPDKWPYLFVRTNKSATESASQILNWLSERGIGLVVNAHKEIPDYVFTYGMVWNFRERGEFITPQESVPEVEINFQKSVWTMPPSTAILPNYVRHVLLDFFNRQNITAPRVNMISQDQKHFDLCFSIESLGSPPESEHRNVAEAISWFLPSHYSIGLVSEKAIPNFMAL